MSVAGWIGKHAAEQPDKTAVVAGDQAVRYRELYRRICSAAAYLSAKGVGRGTHVLSMASPELDYIVCEYAVLGLGGVHIPAENRIPPERMGEIALAVDADLVISPEKPAGDTAWTALQDVDMDGAIDEEWVPAGVSEECSEIIFTTGTTGKSKGVMLSSQCLETYLSVMNPSFGLTKDSVFLVTTPLNHVGGLHRIHQCLFEGCTVVLLEGIRNLRAFFDAIRTYGVTHTYLPPASVKMLLMLAKKELAALDGKLQFIYTASAPFPTSDIEMLVSLLPNTRLHQGYGSSETGSICNCRYNAPDEELTCLGRPYDCVEVILRDEDGNVITEPGKEGYISSRSKMNMLGYYKEPELTASVLKDGFVYSKDLMYFDGKGELHFAGRGDDVINVRGFKVAPTEVEDTALRFEKIRDCVCVPYEDGDLGKVLKMFVVMEDGAEFSPEEIVAYLGTKLEAYKMPKYVECIPEIPRTFNGKVDRKKLVGRQ